MLQPGSSALVVVLWIVAGVGTVVVAAVVWPWLSHRGMLALAGRVGAQWVSGALIVLAVAATLNYQNGWYASWSDVARDLTHTPPTIKQVAVTGVVRPSQPYNFAQAYAADRGAQRKYRIQRASFAAGPLAHAHPGPLGQYVTVHVPGLGGTAGKDAGQVLVWLPPGYTSPAQKTRTYPVIEAFGGQPGNLGDYPKRMHLQNILVSAHRRSGLQDPIMVIPNYQPSGIDTECTNTPGLNMETWLTSAVPQWVMTHLRARPDRRSWATMGFSAGGFCAEMSAILHPNRYGAAMLFGTYNWPHYSNWRPFGRLPWPRRYDLISTIRRHAPAIDVWVEISGADHFSDPPTQALVHATHAPMSTTSVLLQGAGHRFSVWRQELPTAITWLAHTEPSFNNTQPTRPLPTPTGHTPTITSAPPTARHPQPDTPNPHPGRR